jgi:hypothetical protein
VRGHMLAVPLLAVLLATGCSDEGDSNAARERATAAASQSSEAASTQRTTPRVQRLHYMPSGLRPDCRDGRVNRIIPGHAGWRSLVRATAGLLRHPGADHAALSPVAGNRVTVVLYRGDSTTKATALLRHLDDRWFPDSIAVCRSTLS